MRRWGAALAAGVVSVGLTASGLGTASAGTPQHRTTQHRAAHQRTTHPRRVTVGDRRLHRCRIGAGRTTYCGSMRVPLDYHHRGSATIKVGFGWVPSSRRSTGTLLAMEGGPGYPSTGTSGDFAVMYGDRLLRHRDLLLVDARGTGRSTPLRCPRLQGLPSPSPRFQSALTACGRRLNHTWRRANGHWAHASDLFTTANTARDVHQVLGALHLRDVDL
ncbi:MAG TPA: hypothetical protein VGJ24_14665, partial [Nocardioides sp.]